MSRFVLVLLCTALVTGCHGRFKKAAPTLGQARFQVVTTGGPQVQLGTVNDDSLLAAAINIGQAVGSMNKTKRIAQAVDIQSVNVAFEKGVADSLGKGPPFAYTTDEGTALIQVEVDRYGLFVPSLGARGVFSYDLTIRGYDAAGKKIYATSLTCSTNAGEPDELAAVLGVVDNVKQLDSMSDAEINTAFTDIATWCGGQMVKKIRKHAG